MEAAANGRALPPRPTLLVGKAGDVEACRYSWQQLKPLALNVLRHANAGCAGAEELDNIVRRFRSLRESLVAAYVQDEIAVQVYETSADVCLAAQCWPEFLKSVVGLTMELYPVQQATGGQQTLHGRQQEEVYPPQHCNNTATMHGFCLNQQNQQPSSAQPKQLLGGVSGSSAAAETTTTTAAPSVHARGLQTGGMEVATPAVAAASTSAATSVSTTGMPPCAEARSACGSLQHEIPSEAASLGQGDYGKGGSGSSSSSGSCGGGGRGQPRVAEMHAAHGLFLACVPSGRLADAVTLLRNPRTRPYLASCHVKFTIRVLAALARGDWLAFLRLRDAAPCAGLRAILNIHSSQVRTGAIRCLAASFRTLPAPTAAAMLHLTWSVDGCGGLGGSGGGDECISPQTHWIGGRLEGGSRGPERASTEEVGVCELRAALSAAAGAGIRGAEVALEGLSAWGPTGGGEVGELVFR